MSQYRTPTGALKRTVLLTAATLVLAAAPFSALANDDSARDSSSPSEGSEATPLATPEANDASPTPDTSISTKSTESTSGPYGSGYPVIVEANFARPYYDNGANADFSLLNDLERLIRGSYMTPDGKLKPAAQRKATKVYATNFRMEKAKRVSRELVRAARYGVTVRFIHGKAVQSAASRDLHKKLNKERTGAARICGKGKSMACLSSHPGAVAHTKMVMVSSTYTRDGDRALGVVWTGSSNFGGRSAERTFNNGMTVYNDKKHWMQMTRMWADMWAERNVGKDYQKYIRARSSKYGYSGATAAGYTSNGANNGVFYSNLAHVTMYVAPVRATPTNGRDPVLNMLNRIVPDSQCRIRLMENRFKYRRIGVAYKLADLAKKGCRVSIVSFHDPKKSENYKAHCLQEIRVCKPILDVFKTAPVEIDAAYAHPHDKTIIVEAKLKRNPMNPEERTPEGTTWPSTGYRTQLVSSGSAALTGSNLVTSDELTSETTDPEIYEQYLEHWKAITSTKAYRVFKY